MMKEEEAVMHEIEGLPSALLQEVVDFIHFLKIRVVQERSETAILSETALEKDWLRPEEDEDWRDL